MHQYVLWTALDTEGLGCNLQHWNPLPDIRIQHEFDIPELWKLKAQLVFGGIDEKPGEKTFKPLEPRLKVFGQE